MMANIAVREDSALHLPQCRSRDGNCTDRIRAAVKTITRNLLAPWLVFSFSAKLIPS
jgi:hypothetical protein